MSELNNLPKLKIRIMGMDVVDVLAVENDEYKVAFISIDSTVGNILRMTSGSFHSKVVNDLGCYNELMPLFKDFNGNHKTIIEYSVGEANLWHGFIEGKEMLILLLDKPISLKEAGFMGKTMTAVDITSKKDRRQITYKESNDITEWMAEAHTYF